jgi:hypothetical protein
MGFMRLSFYIFVSIFCILLFSALAMAMEKDATKEYTSTLKNEKTFNIIIKLFRLEAKMLKNFIEEKESSYKNLYRKTLTKPHGENYALSMTKKIVFGTFQHMEQILADVLENLDNIKFTKNNLEDLRKKIISDRISLKTTLFLLKKMIIFFG